MKRIFLFLCVVLLSLCMWAQGNEFNSGSVTYPSFKTSAMKTGNTSLPSSTIAVPFTSQTPSSHKGTIRRSGGPGDGHSGGTTITTPGVSIGDGLIPLLIISIIYMLMKGIKRLLLNHGKTLALCVCLIVGTPMRAVEMLPTFGDIDHIHLPALIVQHADGDLSLQLRAEDTSYIDHAQYKETVIKTKDLVQPFYVTIHVRTMTIAGSRAMRRTCCTYMVTGRRRECRLSNP